MRLSKSAAQAVLAMAYLAQQSPEQVIQARQVGEHLCVPTDSALKILQALSRQGLIQSQLGRGGGYRLHRSAADISLTQIVEAIEGPINGRLRLEANSNVLADGLDALQKVCHRAADRVREELAQTTLADLVRQAPAKTLAASR